MLRSSLISRLALLTCAAAVVPQLLACLEHPIKLVEYDKTQVEQTGIQLAVNKDVDILFVIDDSGSMAEEQALLAQNFGAFIGVLEAPDVKANYRIGITTTDMDNPRCSKEANTPTMGDLVLSSCLDRVDQGDFVFNGVEPPLDAAFACTAVCDKTDADLQIRPTTTDRDEEAKARPWLENIEGVTNIPDDVSTLEAFQCFGPPGVAGCGFESHLESMYQALSRADVNGDANYGFLRDEAILSVVFLTDELDCSLNEKHEGVFINNKVFWNDPEDPLPTSSVCLRAGVECTGSGDPNFEECYAENYDEAGAAGASDDDAVLYPVGRYTDFLQGVEDEKRTIASDQEVLVAVIGGVPEGYAAGDEEIDYSSVADQLFLDDFGIAPGCTLGEGTALPPVRMKEFAESFEVGEDRNMYSICQDNYSSALGAIADRIRDQIKPACMPECVKDKDSTTPILEQECTLVEENPSTGDSVPVLECEKDGDEWVPQGDDSVCYLALVDDNGETATTDDDISEYCQDLGWNLEFRVVRNGPAPAGSQITATCLLSELRDVDCPLLGG